MNLRPHLKLTREMSGRRPIFNQIPDQYLYSTSDLVARCADWNQSFKPLPMEIEEDLYNLTTRAQGIPVESIILDEVNDVRS